ncbi:MULTISPECIES: hypothetical protein [Pseudonocardia]|uniref:hypothetical protein n=1 Tax=Pseudonocardia TaxID=1847 RepID=UPI003614846B
MFKSSCHSGSKYSGHDKSWNDDYGKHCGSEYKTHNEWDDKYTHCWDDKRYDDCWDDKSYDDKSSCHDQSYKHCNDDYSHSSSSYGHH